MAEIQAAAARTRDMGEKTAAFWKMEHLSSAFLKQRQPGQSLRDASMPIEIRPIAHCGMGIAAVEVAEFQALPLSQIIDSFSDPEYRLFAYEGAGAMLALYEPDLFGLMTQVSRKLGLLPLAPLKRPDHHAFLRAYEPEVQRLIAHGYGRMLYFKNHSISSAVRDAQRAYYLQTRACVQGIAFAYSMVNNSDLISVFRAGEECSQGDLGAAFRDGLIYALEFWEWMAPGFLDGLAPRRHFEADLIRTAREALALARIRGALAPFSVERPVIS